MTTAACSSGSDDAKVVSTEVDDATTTTVDQTSDTSVATTTTLADDSTDSTDASDFTEEETTCIVDGIKGAPALGAYSSDQDLVDTGSQADKETYHRSSSTAPVSRPWSRAS